MFGIGQRSGQAAKAAQVAQVAQAAQLGTALAALRLHGAVRLPPGCVELVFSAAGQARRAPASRAGRGEIAYAYHPGPYETAFAPFAAAPETGLRLRYLADAADPRVAQQRFDLFLFSEAGEALPVDGLHSAVAGAVRDALAQGMLELPACTTLDEWHAFRGGLNELLYTRFGLTVDDCVPVDLGDSVDYAELLRMRARQVSGPAIATPAAGGATAADGQPAAASARHDGSGQATSPANAGVAATAPDAGQLPLGVAREPDSAAQLLPGVVQEPHSARQLPIGVVPKPHGTGQLPPGVARDPHGAVQNVPAAFMASPAPAASGGPAAADAHALRRLFLELPAWSASVRALPLPAGQPLFAARRGVLQRCAQAALDVNTMPSLAWATPDRRLPGAPQAQRAAHSVAAVQALDQAWALLARWRLAGQDSTDHARLLDDADRLTANLAYHLAGRRAIGGPAVDDGQRREPQL